MAKNMARIYDGVVINIERHSDKATETDHLKFIGDRLVAIGDIYNNGTFSRDGVEVLTTIDLLNIDLKDMQDALKTLGVNPNG